MHVKLLGQFRQGLLTLDGSQRYFRLEHRRVVAAGSSRHGRSCSRPYWPPSGTKSTYPAVQFSRATSRLTSKELVQDGQGAAGAPPQSVRRRGGVVSICRRCLACRGRKGGWH